MISETAAPDKARHASGLPDACRLSFWRATARSPDSAAADQRHHRFGVSLTAHRVARDGAVELGDIVARQPDVGGGGIFLESLGALGPRDRHDVLTLGQNPG